MSTKEQERLSAAIRQVASATFSSPMATAEQGELARAVLMATDDAVKRKALGGPREEHQIADVFNRMLDALLDSSNRSRGLDRPGRRVHLAAGMERAGLVLVDQAELARMFGVQLELGLARQRIAELEKEREDCVIAAGVGCTLTPIEAIEELKDRIEQLDSWPTGEIDESEESLGAELLAEELQEQGQSGGGLTCFGLPVVLREDMQPGQIEIRAATRQVDPRPEGLEAGDEDLERAPSADYPNVND